MQWLQNCRELNREAVSIASFALSFAGKICSGERNNGCISKAVMARHRQAEGFVNSNARINAPPMHGLRQQKHGRHGKIGLRRFSSIGTQL